MLQLSSILCVVARLVPILDRNGTLAGLLVTLVLTLSTSHCVSGLETLPKTAPLTENRPLDVVMVEGIDRFARRAIVEAGKERVARWESEVFQSDSPKDLQQIAREDFSSIIGCIDARIKSPRIQTIATIDDSSLIESNEYFSIHRVRWPVLPGMDAEGYFLKPHTGPLARVIAIPDADWTPEQICGLAESPTRYASDLAALGCEVLVPTLVNRSNEYSCNESINRVTNLPHREFIYRQAFELGRHIIGYEVQKVLAAVDIFESRNERDRSCPIGVCGVREGGLLAFYSGAIDTRIDATLVSGYFNQRDQVWEEPIYRNVWRLLDNFGDAQIAAMIAPRSLMIEVNPMLPILKPLPNRGRVVAAPGHIPEINPANVSREINLARHAWDVFATQKGSRPLGSGKLIAKTLTDNSRQPISTATSNDFLNLLTSNDPQSRASAVPDYQVAASVEPSIIDQRQQICVKQMTDYTQRLLQLSHRVRNERWNQPDRSSIRSWEISAQDLRQQVHHELIGRLPTPTIASRPRTRQIINEDAYEGFEVVLDVYPDVIAAGVLLMPKGIKPGEERPVVVCQHGLEGTPMDTIIEAESRAYQAYKAFSVQLVRQGYIVYAPQNPYRGHDKFRTLQRKSNPLGRTLFSYIIPQHLVSLRWLASLPQVDADRIGFYGLSYGGKTAVRVPPLLPPTQTEPGYALSICSADFNEWVSKNASTDAPFSYVWTPEYEIFEWNMGNIANYAELAMLMAPRPFMVERGHHDGVGIDEWVAWEFAKVRRHFAALGITDHSQIEFFDGPHTINGKGTFDFLRRHLRTGIDQQE